MSLGDFFEDIFGEDLVDLFGDIFNYFTEDETGQALTSLLGSYFLNQSGYGQPQIPQVGYQGGIPLGYDPNRRPGSGGRRYLLTCSTYQLAGIWVRM